MAPCVFLTMLPFGRSGALAEGSVSPRFRNKFIGGDISFSESVALVEAPPNRTLKK